MKILSKETIALLDDIERRIDPETELDMERQWSDFLHDRFSGDIFTPKRKKISPQGINIPGVNINDAIEDYDLMLRHQMLAVSASLNNPSANICIRSNYGTGIMSSILGAEIFKMPRKNNTLPTTKSLNDTEKIRAIVEKGMPDITNAFGKNVFEFGELCLEVFEKYPKIKRFVTVYHPDTQGPLDVCELLWGCDMFYAIYDEPELVHQMLSLITDLYIAVMDKWYEMYKRNPDINPHWGTFWHKGSIVLRSDSAMNISPELYKEFSAPYDQKLLDRYDGGAIHFCGKGDHYVDIISEFKGLYCVHMSQPQYNDMEKIYKYTVDKGIKLLSASAKQAEADRSRKGCFNHCLHV